MRHVGNEIGLHLGQAQLTRRGTESESQSTQQDDRQQDRERQVDHEIRPGPLLGGRPSATQPQTPVGKHEGYVGGNLFSLFAAILTAENQPPRPVANGDHEIFLIATLGKKTQQGLLDRLGQDDRFEVMLVHHEPRHAQ